MRFLMAFIVYAVAGVFLTYGIIQTMHGKPWLLIFGFVFYVVLLGAIGCLPKKSH